MPMTIESLRSGELQWTSRLHYELRNLAKNALPEQQLEILNFIVANFEKIYAADSSGMLPIYVVRLAQALPKQQAELLNFIMANFNKIYEKAFPDMLPYHLAKLAGALPDQKNMMNEFAAVKGIEIIELSTTDNDNEIESNPPNFLAKHRLTIFADTRLSNRHAAAFADSSQSNAPAVTPSPGK